MRSAGGRERLPKCRDSGDLVSGASRDRTGDLLLAKKPANAGEVA